MTPTATRTSEPCTGREGGWTDNVIRYDGMASRAELVDSGGTTRYTWDGIRVLKTEDDVGTLRQRQVHGESPSGIPSVGDMAIIESSAGNAYVPEADQVGTITKVLDSSASVANSYTYDAFGVTRSASEAFSNPYRFAGKPLDADPALYHFIARQYDPKLGVFARRDRVATPASYGYAMSSPLSLLDPSGLDELPAGVTLSGIPMPRVECPSGEWRATGWGTSRWCIVRGILEDRNAVFECEDTQHVADITYDCCWIDSRGEECCVPAQHDQAIRVQRQCAAYAAATGWGLGYGIAGGRYTFVAREAVSSRELDSSVSGWGLSLGASAGVGGECGLPFGSRGAGGLSASYGSKFSVGVRSTTTISVSRCWWEPSVGPPPVCGGKKYRKVKEVTPR